MRTRAEIRRELEQLRADLAAAGIGVSPTGVIEVRQVGECGEDRPPGIYYSHGRRGLTLVHAGDVDAAIAEFLPEVGKDVFLISGEARPTELL